MDRKFILEEIHRTAMANGGGALGKLRFQADTGIKETDWSGKHWARWSDALREAGFEPNEMQSSYLDEHVLEHFAATVVALGRLPTIAELKLRSREVTGFPSHNTFSRFGNRESLLARVHAYCVDRPEFSVVAALTASYTGLAVVHEQGDSVTQEAVGSFGTVYLIKSASYYKIGRTNSLGRRERELAIQLPERSKTAHSIQTDDPAGIEAYWHRRFETKRKNGEWFALAPADVAAFRRRKFM